MIVKVSPAACAGRVAAPPSKSIAHRALICAGLAAGESRLTGIGTSEDMSATIGALRALGAEVERRDGFCLVRGCGGRPPMQDAQVDCRESGSTLRFMIPLFALGSGRTRFVGRGRLMQRPQSVYSSLFAQRGLPFALGEDGLSVQGPLTPGEYALDGGVSSQFITGLLLALPLLAGDSRIVIHPPFQSRGYVDLTLQALAAFGVRAAFDTELSLLIPGGQTYRPCDYSVEGDYSQAAFFAVLAALSGNVTLTGLRRDSLQGDQAILSILRDFGAQFCETPEGLRFSAAPLAGRTVDVGDCPDLAPILTVLGACASGETRLVNAARLRDKESDRIAAMEEELGKLGIKTSSTQDTLTVEGCGGAPRFAPATVDGHNDHRIVMSLAVLATLGSAPLRITGAEAVRKSYPDFFDDLARIGGATEVEHE